MTKVVLKPQLTTNNVAKYHDNATQSIPYTKLKISKTPRNKLQQTCHYYNTSKQFRIINAGC